MKFKNQEEVEEFISTYEISSNESQSERIQIFNELWQKGLINDDPVRVGQVMGVSPAYLKHFIQWYKDLGDLEYTPWIDKY